MSINLKLTPRKDALLLGHDNTLDILVRAIGPAMPEGMPKRRRLNLAIVIDRSGSMRGQPLDEAKRCAKIIVGQLTAEDFVSVVAYGSSVEVVCPAQPVTDVSSICASIDRIRTGGMTALHKGWVAGAEQASINAKAADISRVLLLSDGNANEGLTDNEQIAKQCAQMAGTGVSTSTYGLGEDFNEVLMFAMANAGTGNAYYGQTAQDLMTPFQEEFDLLQALYARNAQLEFSTPSGVRIKMANDLSQTERGWRLPDIAYGSEAWAIVRLHVPRNIVTAAENSRLDLLTARLIYSTDGNDVVMSDGSVLSVKALPESAYVALAEDELVSRRAQEVRFAEFQRDAGEAASHGDWERVDRILDDARQEANGNAWLLASMAALVQYARERSQARFTKEARYQTSKKMRRLASTRESISYCVSIEDLEPSFLRRRDEEGKG